MSKVTDIASRNRIRSGERLKMSVDDDGALLIRISGGPRYALPNGVAIRALEDMLGTLRRAQARLAGIATAEPHDSKAPRWRACRLTRDGGRGPFGGCRRRNGHSGPCRDAEGGYTPAICSHIGYGVTNVWLPDHTGRRHCRHCNADLGPCAEPHPLGWA